MRIASQEAGHLATTLDGLDRRINALGSVDLALVDARDVWKGIGDQEFQLLANQATALTAASKGDLKVNVSKGKTVDHLTDALANAIQGANVTRDKVARMVQTVHDSAMPFDEWLAIVDELLYLVEGEQAGTPPTAPKLSAAGSGSAELKRMGVKLNASAAFELSLQRPNTLPSFPTECRTRVTSRLNRPRPANNQTRFYHCFSGKPLALC